MGRPTGDGEIPVRQSLEVVASVDSKENVRQRFDN